MIDIPFRIVDLIMKFAGAYSQNIYKSPYLEDIKLMMFPNSGPKQALWSIRFQKYEYHIVSWDLFTEMMWGRTLNTGGNYLVKLGD